MLEQVRLRFGEVVAKIVAVCSDTFGHPKPDYPKRKATYVEHLASDASIETCLVCAADKLHNARAILHDLRATKQPLDFWALLLVSETRHASPTTCTRIG
jgi:(p)ppGpp synthase/HD superfamily hydrolase